MSNLSVVVFNIFSFVFSVQQFVYDVSGHGFLCVYLVWGFLSFLNVFSLFLLNLRKFQPLFLQICLLPHTLLLSFWDAADIFDLLWLSPGL